MFAEYGVKRIASDNVARKPAFRAELAAMLQEHGPFDIVHAHNDFVAGPVLRYAQALGVKARIAHAHNDIRPGYGDSGFIRRRYIDRSLRWVNRHATHGFAASENAGVAVYRKAWGSDPRFKPLYYGDRPGPV